MLCRQSIHDRKERASQLRKQVTKLSSTIEYVSKGRGKGTTYNEIYVSLRGQREKQKQESTPENNDPSFWL